jgi:SecD/SecF fusion protein
MSDRRRNGFILLLVLGLIVASAAAIVTKKTRLGLDLKGGVELVYQGKPTPQQPKVDAEAIDRALDIMRQRVDKLGVSEPEIQRSGADQISVGLPDVKNAQRAIKQVGKVAQLFFYDWEPNVIGPNGKTDPTNQQVTDTPLPSLLDAVKLAATRPRIDDGDNTTNDQWFLFDGAGKLVAGPEDTRANLFTDLRRRPAKEQIFVVRSGTVIIKAEKPDNWPDKVPFERYFVVNDDPSLNGTDIKNPKQDFDRGPGGTGSPIVTMDFTKKGRQKFQDVTRQIAQRGVEQQLPGQPAQNAFQHFAIALDNELVSRPYIDFNQNPDGIDGRTGAQISGGFTIQTAQDLANFLKIGALPIKLELISQSQVSATLGKEALHQGLIAGLVGFAVVALFLIAFYRVLGLIAVSALFVYALYFYALIKLIPITLTLPGIAGLILTIGVAADANIVIFERVKEEMRGGNSIPRSITAGYKKGLTAIIDANVVTLMTAFILFILATAGVKGFAFTLGVGTMVSLFTAVMATQAILTSMSRTRVISSPAALGAAEGKQRFRFDYMGNSKWFFSMSGVILLIGALAIGGKGIKFGIDFESGTRIKTTLERAANEDQVRNVMGELGYADAKIQRVKEGGSSRDAFQISTSTLQPSKVQEVKDGLDKRFGVGEDFSNQSIGPTFGNTVAKSALIAIVASLLVISAYIALRFQWKYAVPVLIALMHDILITGGVYALVGREVTTSTVAALLTILGFSLYDTIIVFDRVRENVPRMPRAAFSQIVNRSMSEVIVRSLATSFCTLLPVLALLLFGGETLRDFAFALMVGVASGAYSSIFIAGPVLTHWKEREELYRHRIERIREENNGVVPAYAVATAGGPVDVEPTQRAVRRGRLTQPQEPGEVSRDEFDEMVRELGHGESPAQRAGLATKPRSRRAGRPQQPPPAPEAAPPETKASEPGAVASDDVLDEAAQAAVNESAQRDKKRKPRNRRHGRKR